jgi:hypothetical protein
MDRRVHTHTHRLLKNKNNITRNDATWYWIYLTAPNGPK